jgi:hypothetical protein
LFTTREIVAVETPAISATSRIVTRCADLVRVSVVALEGMCKPYMYDPGPVKAVNVQQRRRCGVKRLALARYTLDS